MVMMWIMIVFNYVLLRGFCMDIWNFVVDFGLMVCECCGIY